MTGSRDFFIKFWGVRGSIASPGPRTVRYGGNTSCIEVQCDETRVIFDGGTGLRDLGDVLACNPPERIDLFLTHTHHDHVAGVPFFKPAYMAGTRVDFWAGHLPPETPLQEVMRRLMQAPLFPVPIDRLGDCRFNSLVRGAPIQPGPGIELKPCPLRHPNGACGYRISYAGKSICIITDTEHVPGTLDQTIVDFVRGADIMVYDAMFTDEEFPQFITWGHSTWQEALRIADAAGVRVVVPFHHSPSHDDDCLDRLAEIAQTIRRGTVFASEGLVLHP
jgi:phosphoribosyl 1,2-cyclic phosphodiesterase